MLSNNKNIFLASQITKSIEMLLKLAGTTLGFDIVELWTTIDDKPQCIYVHVEPDVLKSYPSLLHGHYPSHKKEHKISPSLCNLSKDANGAYWKIFERNSPGFFVESGKDDSDGFRHLDSGYVVKTELAYKLKCIGDDASRPDGYIVSFSASKIDQSEVKANFLLGLGMAIYAAFDLEDEDHHNHQDHHDHIGHFETHTPRVRSSISIHNLAGLADSGITDLESASINDSQPSTPVVSRRKSMSSDNNSTPDSIAIHDKSILIELEADEDDAPYHFSLSNLKSTKIPNNLVFDEFTKVVHITDGSNSNIYTGYWHNEKVLIKIIKESVKTNTIAIHEFLMELAILSRMDHPNIVKVKGSGTKPRRFIVLEYLGGGSLNTLLDKTEQNSGITNKLFKKPTFPYLELLRKARSIAAAFHYCHSQIHADAMVLHRDLKPDNVGFTGDGELKLFDFGLSTCVKKRASLDEAYEMSGIINSTLFKFFKITCSTGNTGSLRYMAPEVALGLPYSEKADVYSYGILLWQMARDKVPFKGMSRENFTKEVVKGGERPKLDKNWPQSFALLLTDCWHKDQQKRPSFESIINRIDELSLEDTTKSWFGTATKASGSKSTVIPLDKSQGNEGKSKVAGFFSF